MAFTYFTSSDSGAPALTGVNGSLITVLDWILVTKGLWTKEFSGTNKAIYRPPSGNRYYLRVVHDSAISGASNQATVRGCESATDIDTYTDPFPTVAQRADSSTFWLTSTTTNSTTRAYFGIVTDTYVFICVRASSNNAVSVCFFGDTIPVFSGDVYSTVIFTTNTASISSWYQIANTTGRLYYVRSYDGTVKSTTAMPLISYAAASQTNFSGFTAPAYPHPIDSKMHMEKVALTCYGATSSSRSATKSIIKRSWFPNLWSPLHSESAVTTEDTFTDSSYNPLSEFVIASSATSNASLGQFFVLEKTNTWSAPNG